MKPRPIAPSLEASFLTPPTSDRPWIWWQWNNGNVSPEGVKADLQAIHDAGISGVQLFDVAIGAPHGSIHYMDAEWMACWRTALAKADQLGLDMGIHNCDGWSSSGGPWIKPEDSMKMLVGSETSAHGPGRFSGTLPQPETREGLYQDVALFAISSAKPLVPVKAECALASFDAEKLQTGAPDYSLKVPRGSEHSILLDFGKPVTPRSLFLRLARKSVLYIKSEVSASDDGISFRRVREFKPLSVASSISLDSNQPVSARYFKISLSPQFAAAFPSLKEVAIEELWLSEQNVIESAKEKSGNGSEFNFPRSAEHQPEPANPRQIINLSDRMKASGALEWDIPEGDWTLLRIGYTSTGQINGPGSQGGVGLECDKLNSAALDIHWNAVLAPLLKEKGLKNTVIDSYEKGGQNWTPGIVEQFKASRGYDPIPFLPAIFGTPVVSKDISERFLYDWRTNVSDLMVENYFGHFATLCSKNGLESYMESYGGPFDNMAAGRSASVPMDGRLASSTAHVYGRELVSKEAFTIPTDNLDGGWHESPSSLKRDGDGSFCNGMNQLILHSYVHQPLMDQRAKPGMALGQYGSHFGRNQTWWPFAKVWTDYLARCQFMPRQGRFQADVCVFPGENAPNAFNFGKIKEAGYDYDACDRNALVKLFEVKDGRLTLPSGMSYRLLKVDDSRLMSVEVLKTIEKLINEGAVVCASRPLGTPGLTGYPKSDQELAATADRLWGTKPAPNGDLQIGKGRLLWGVSAIEALGRLGVGPDFAIEGKVAPRIGWIHRSSDKGEIYFINNQTDATVNFTALFRSEGNPELWHPESGKVESCAVYSAAGSRIRLPIELPASGSVFVVIRKSGSDSENPVSLAFKPFAEKEAAGTGVEIQKAFYGARDGSRGKDVTEILKQMITANGVLSLQVSNETFGGDPAGGIVKSLSVDFAIDGTPGHKEVPEFESLSLMSKATKAALESGCQLAKSADGRLQAVFSANGVVEIEFASNRKAEVTCTDLPPPILLDGSWHLAFPPDLGAPAEAVFEKLRPLPESDIEGIRHFSGIVTYEKDFNIPSASLAGGGRSFALSLGDVGVGGVAQVELNGVDLGVAWTPPFTVDASKAVKSGTNKLVIKLATPWANRLIGDEALPDDSEYLEDGHVVGSAILKTIPKWLLDGTPRPGQRVAFPFYKSLRKNSKLVLSGLVGPVVLGATQALPVNLK